MKKVFLLLLLFFAITFANSQTDLSKKDYFERIKTYLIDNDITDKDHFGISQECYITISYVSDKIVIGYFYQKNKVGERFIFPDKVSISNIKDKYLYILEKQRIFQYSESILEILANNGSTPPDGTGVSISIVNKK